MAAENVLAEEDDAESTELLYVSATFVRQNAVVGEMKSSASRSKELSNHRWVFALPFRGLADGCRNNGTTVYKELPGVTWTLFLRKSHRLLRDLNIAFVILRI